MTPAEAAALLTVAAAFDNRKPDADQARAWAMALDDLRFEDCREGIVDHYRASREWMMPVDVREKVKKIRDARILAYGPIKPPADIDPDDTAAIQRYEVDMRRAIADGEVTNPAPELEVGPLDREAAKARMKLIRAELARRSRAGLVVIGGSMSTQAVTVSDCGSCGEGIPTDECSESKRPCGHHCNHVWIHDQCCWCDTEIESEE